MNFSEFDSLRELVDRYDGNISSYFSKAVEFLEEYKWIYDFKLTEIFSLHIPERIPKEWLFLQDINYDELNRVPNFTLQDDTEWPPSFKHFLKSSQALSIQRESCHSLNDGIVVSKDIKRGISPKKLHEIVRMSNLISRCCVGIKTNCVLDVGSGLAYLDQVLHHNFGYYVVGLESVEYRRDKAEERVSEQGCSSGIVQKKVEFNENVGKELSNIVKALKLMMGRRCSCNEINADAIVGEQHSVVMSGLHCCGDLSPNMLKLFLQNSDIRCLCCVGCCYHFMLTDEIGGKRHNNFPMSQRLSNVLKDIPEFVVSTYGMRLASQETISRWKMQSPSEHEWHVRNVGYRAVLQVYANRRDIKLKKRKRRGACRHDFDSFDHYIDAVSSNYNVSGHENVNFKSEMKKTFNEFKDWFRSIELITLLQVMMQPVLESLILVDRCCYLKENEANVYLVPVFDDLVSPRNLAIVAFKDVEK